MSLTTTNFLISQLRCAKREPRGRRWTVDEKVVALALYKRSPKCYNLLRKIVAMPSRRTLLSLLEKIPFSAGINKHLFKHINDNLKSDEDRCCVLLFDEMDIMENFTYDQSNDVIVGFEDMGKERRYSQPRKSANRALVFMCQGLARKWKQPVAYYFSYNGSRSNDLVKCLMEVLFAAKHFARLDVVGIICDIGSSNVKALKELHSTIETPFIQFEDKNIYTMFDPPHLLKCTVSLFRKHNVIVPVAVGDTEELMTAKFQDIQEAHEIDKRSPLIFRAMHKIKDTHLTPVMKYAMKVNLAAQVMSRTVAAFLYTLLSRGELEQRSLATATFIQQVDELFHSFNGSHMTPPPGKEVKCFVTEESGHMSYWKRAFNVVKRWQFKRYTKQGQLRSGKPPSQSGWLVSLRAIQGIWLYLKNKGFTSLRPRSLNQDSLENLFGPVRSGCVSGDNPTTFQFMGSLKTQILNGLTSHALHGTNCEEDENTLLSNLKSFINVEESSRDVDDLSVTPLDLQREVVENISSNIATAVSQGDTETLSVAYLSGFIAKGLLTSTDKCQQCRSLLCSEEDALHNQFIVFKEWTDQEKRLTYPTEALVVAIGQAITVIEMLLNNDGSKSAIGHFLYAQIQLQVDFSWFSCTAHKVCVLQSLIKAICRIGIQWWCKRKNRDIKQKRKEARASNRKIKKFKHV
ncbi:hypothetical protein NQ315_010953 [Exocentrus adspersus]|uniref:Transposable element P transposase n=1 Tax=Exocentrus adspersus TaxID=1586481 RepID=A0AAV8VGT8_9CUCU|nr:hypothetical protein NQ315_010953 [Exocentrus adspersus]